MSPSYLMAASAAIVGMLGCAHLVLTFRGPKLLPRNSSLVDAMRETAPVITKQTHYWNMWMGFNASHSMGLMLFGLCYGYLALAHADLLFGSPFLLTVGGLMLTGYVVLAKRYWFITPLAGATVSLLLYAGSIVVAMAG